MTSRHQDARTVLTVALLLAFGALAHLPGIRTDRALAARVALRSDPVSGYDRWFGALAPFLPARATIGYLEPPAWPDAGAVRTFYLAQYALAPRIVVLGTHPEFVIAVPDTGVETKTAASDPRLTGFALVRRFEDGLLLFRREK